MKEGRKESERRKESEGRKEGRKVKEGRKEERRMATHIRQHLIQLLGALYEGFLKER